jgi:hypothetical protein
VRGYGLFAANPFGSTVFTGDKLPKAEKPAPQDIQLDANGTMHFRYRVIVHAGDAKEAGIGKMWDQYLK